MQKRAEAARTIISIELYQNVMSARTTVPKVKQHWSSTEQPGMKVAFNKTFCFQLVIVNHFTKITLSCCSRRRDQIVKEQNKFTDVRDNMLKAGRLQELTWIKKELRIALFVCSLQFINYSSY